MTAALHTYQQASRGAQNAILVGIAVRAVTRVLDRGIDLGLGR